MVDGTFGAIDVLTAAYMQRCRRILAKAQKLPGLTTTLNALVWLLAQESLVSRAPISVGPLLPVLSLLSSMAFGVALLALPRERLLSDHVLYYTLAADSSAVPLPTASRSDVRNAGGRGATLPLWSAH